MIQLQIIKQIGNSKLYEVKLIEKTTLNIYVTKQEVQEIAKFYTNKQGQGEQQVKVEECLEKLPCQGQLFLILNNIMDWRKVDISSLLEIAKQDELDELSFINKFTIQKISDELQGTLDAVQTFKSENKFILLQRNILLYQLLSQTQQYEKSLEVLLNEITKLEGKDSKDCFLFYLFNCYINSSSLLSLHGRREEALENLNKADLLLKKLFEGDELIYYKTVVKINVANIQQDLFDFESVSDILNKCLKDLDKIKGNLPYKVQRLMAQVHNNLSTCYQQEGDEKLDKSLEHSLISLQMNEAYFGNSMNSEIAKNLMNISSIYKDLSMFGESITYAQKAEEIFTKIEDKENLPICLGMIASIYQDETIGNYTQAKDYSLKCVEQLEKNGKKNTIDYSIALLTLGGIYNSLSQFEDALKPIQLSLKLFQEMKEEHGQMQCFELISKVYKSLNNLDEAIDNLYDAIQIREKLDKDDPTEELFLDYSNIAIMWEEKGDTDESQFYTNKAKKLEKKLKQYDD